MCICKRFRNNDSLILGRVILFYLVVGNLVNFFISMFNINICIFERFCKRYCNKIKLYNFFFVLLYLIFNLEI